MITLFAVPDGDIVLVEMLNAENLWLLFHAEVGDRKIATEKLRIK